MTKDRAEEWEELNFTFPVGKRKVKDNTIATVYKTWKERWDERFKELERYQVKHGHTDVPQG